MQHVFRSLLIRIRDACSPLLNNIFEPKTKEIYKKWISDNGDYTHRLFYNLDEKSLVLDLGGYKGQWTSDIFSMYQCTIHVFEPVHHFADEMRNRFKKNNKINIFEFGLSNKTMKSLISIHENGSSIHNIKGTVMQEITLIDVIDFFKENSINNVDLMKINIEGGEYDLLEYLIKTQYITKINNIQIQFHDFIPNAEFKMKNIQQQLSKTHTLTYQYPFVWENWTKIDN